jgi:RES domain
VPFARVWHLSDLPRDPLAHRDSGPQHRFDPHARSHLDPGPCPEGRGVLYLGRDLLTAAAEVFGDELSRVDVCPRWRVTLASSPRRLRLLDLTADGALRIGALPSLATADEPRALTQAWARAIWEDFPKLGGIRYPGAHQLGACLALWNRARAPEPFLVAGRRHELSLHHPGIWRRLLVAFTAWNRALTVIPSEDCPRCRAAGLA